MAALMAESGERIIETSAEPVENLVSEKSDAVRLHAQTEPDSNQQQVIDQTSNDQSENKESSIADTHQRDRDIILDASLHLFAQKGFFQTSLVDISARAQLSKTSLYKHFQNKEAIADALYNDLTERLEQTLAEIHENSSTSIGCLRSIVEFLLDLTEQAPDVSRLLFCPKDMGLLTNKSSTELFPAYQRMVSIFKEGMNSGELEPTNAKLAYCTFMGSLAYVIQLYLEGDLAAPLAQHHGEIWYPVWRALGKNPNRAC